MSGPLLRVADLHTHFRVGSATLRAVDGVSFSLERGQTLGIVGESGSGKSTVARTILGLERATSGSITFDGRELTGLRPREWRPLRRRVQMVFQDPYASLNPRLTVGDLVGEPLRIHEGADRRAAHRRASELLELVGLPAAATAHYPHEFSGGQRQRINIARALALGPELIVADEPVSALDVSVQAQLLNLMRDLQRELGLSYLFISHDLNVVRYLCDRTVVMYLGQVVEQGETDRLWDRPEHPYTRALLAAVPELHEHGSRAAARGEPPSPISPPSGCRFHTRCPVAVPACADLEPPLLRPQGDDRDHEVRCTLVADRS